MSGWKSNKRFWKETTVAATDGGFQVLLDGRAVKTPAKAGLVLPTESMAQGVAAEWDAQGDEIAPLSMVVTRSANAAIDKVVHQHAEVADMLAAYGGTDLLCYRATEPQELVQRQNELWNPVLDWAEGALGARLVTAAGVMFIAQAEDHLEALRAPIHAMSAFEVAAFHDLVSLSGSLILGYAAVHDMCPVEDIWQLSRLDETWQIEQWGVDDEAAELAETKRLAFIHAHKFYQMAKT